MPTIPSNDRPKTDMARMVDVAIALRDEFGARAAAGFLAAAGAGFRLTVRVLSEPRQRRQLTPAKLPPAQ